jgi:tetratricopeptide (TPR) repeat protein
VSLLMDALKKAEEAKRQSEAAAKIEPQEQPPPAAGPQAEASETTPRGLPELPTRLELLDHEFHPSPAARQEPSVSPAAQPARRAEEEGQKRERAAAQNLFQAKPPAPRRAFPLVVGALTVLAAAGIGGYFWWQLQPKGGTASTGGIARPAAAPVAPTPIASTPSAPPPAMAAPVAAAPAQETRTPAQPAPTSRETAAATPAAEPASPIRITTGRQKVHPQIASAYQAFQAGDLAGAQRDYQLALKGDPKNTDALHGLAAVSLRQGQFDAAENLYLRILEADPKDHPAQAGLIGLKGQVDPVQSESRLKNLLASQPDSPFLNFTLGNLYAGQGRWNDAQQAYFRAYAADSENPDYQFNLAVSLEQLRQPRLALQYYQGALAAAAQRPAAFDRNQVAGRVIELQK